MKNYQQGPPPRPIKETPHEAAILNLLAHTNDNPGEWLSDNIDDGLNVAVVYRLIAQQHYEVRLSAAQGRLYIRRKP